MRIAIIKMIIVKFIGLFSSKVNQAIIIIIVVTSDIIVIYVFQFIDPSIHSYIVPVESIIINIVINNVICVDQDVRIGITSISVISISKMINRIINKKNRRENGLREADSVFMPHSNVEYFSDHFFIVILNSNGVIMMVAVIVINKNEYIFSGIINCIKHDHWCIVRLVNKRYMLESSKFLVQILNRILKILLGLE